MAMSPRAWFDYRIVVARTAGVLTGTACDPDEKLAHPGLVGQRPIIELIDGVLRMSRSVFDRVNASPAYGHWGPPLEGASFDAGRVLERVAADGDVLFLDRGANGDIGLMLVREGRLLAAIGAVGLRVAVAGIRAEDDPRARELGWLLRLLRMLEHPQVRLVWLNAAEPDLRRHIAVVREEIAAAPDHARFVIAVAGETAQRVDVYSQFQRLPLSWDDPRVGFAPVSRAFTSCDEWLAFLRAWPLFGPPDLYVRFTFGNQTVDVTEGDGGFIDPWHLWVSLVDTPGIPGRHSHIAVVRAHPEVDAAMVKESCDAVTRGLHRQGTGHFRFWIDRE